MLFSVLRRSAHKFTSSLAVTGAWERGGSPRRFPHLCHLSTGLPRHISPRSKPAGSAAAAGVMQASARAVFFAGQSRAATGAIISSEGIFSQRVNRNQPVAQT